MLGLSIEGMGTPIAAQALIPYNLVWAVHYWILSSVIVESIFNDPPRLDGPRCTAVSNELTRRYGGTFDAAIAPFWLGSSDNVREFDPRIRV